MQLPAILCLLFFSLGPAACNPIDPLSDQTKQLDMFSTELENAPPLDMLVLPESISATILNTTDPLISHLTPNPLTSSTSRDDNGGKLFCETSVASPWVKSSLKLGDRIQTRYGDRWCCRNRDPRCNKIGSVSTSHSDLCTPKEGVCIRCWWTGFAVKWVASACADGEQRAGGKVRFAGEMFEVNVYRAWTLQGLGQGILFNDF
ncbi:hypothetical protein EDC01DRAFT_654295 [Geopyxis carbonaria]|nr:hypothetical protein EDC01DRAFT_654295 [Geopyxis carbonaria]